jgi:hypothetical protein
MKDDWRKAEIALIIIENRLLANNDGRAGRVADHLRVCSIRCSKLQNEVVLMRCDGIRTSGSEC